MNLDILADTKFGWTFIVSEILILYVIFLVVHRVIEKRVKRK